SPGLGSVLRSVYRAAAAFSMSSLPCGLLPVHSQGPDWMPRVSLEPPALKMLSLVVLMASLTKSTARAPLALVVVPWKSLKTWSQSCEVLGLSVVTLASSSKRPDGTTSGRVPLGVVPKKFRGTRALTVIEMLAPPARLALSAVSNSLGLIEEVSKPFGSVESTYQASWLLASSGSWSVRWTLRAVPAPVLLTVMVKEAVWPGVTVALETDFVIVRVGLVSTNGLPVRSALGAARV